MSSRKERRSEPSMIGRGKALRGRYLREGRIATFREWGGGKLPLRE
jgi:hypothetical protein